ncbi:VOC family protein [Pseudonocardia phyllosphaerae]|uniref:VOC family protein n=1 Tax=Pseudonocardia phyllosphaerae TaxID=3390502 RepID=UPI0039782330
MRPIRTCFWFDGVAEEAAKHYTSIFPDSSVDGVLHHGPESDRSGEVLTVSFTINGQPCTGLNGGPEFTFSEAISLEVPCDTAEEVDRFYDALVEGGSPQPCGWLTDRFGVSWQVIPPRLLEYLGSDDAQARGRVAEVLFATHGKLDTAALDAAWRG